VKADEFIHILTRVVNSKHGARFLELVHEMREVLEDAGVSEEIEAKLEPGKPIRFRSPDDIAKKPKMNFPPPPPLPDLEHLNTEIKAPPPLNLEEVTAGEPAKTPEGAQAVADVEIPAAPSDASGGTNGKNRDGKDGQAEKTAVVDASTDQAPPAETPIAGEPPREEFVAAGPNRFVRKPDAAPPPPEADAKPKRSRKDSVRAIILEALQEGDRTMAEIEEIVRGRKGEVPHLYQQAHLALKKIGAQKGGDGRFTLPKGGPAAAAPVASPAPDTSTAPEGKEPEEPSKPHQLDIDLESSKVLATGGEGDPVEEDASDSSAGE
jgi:hypothetical protein